MINKTLNFISRHFYLIIIIALIIQVALVCSNQFIRMFNSDEFESIHVAWMMSQGQSIYTDFFEHHHPFFYYLLVPLIIIGKSSVLTLYLARLSIFVNLLFVYFITYKIASLIKGRNFALISLLILNNFIFFLTTATEIRPDNLQLSFSLLALYFLILFFKKSRVLFLVLTAASLGVSLLFLQKAIFFIAPVFLFLLLLVWKKKISGRSVFIFLISFLFPIIPYFVYLALSGNLNVYLQNFWLFNLLVEMRQPIIKFYFSLLITNILAWSLFFLGLVKARLEKEQFLLFFGFISLFILLALAPTPFKLNQYYTVIAPLLAMVAAFGFHYIKDRNKKIAAIVLVLLTIFPAVFLVAVQIKAPNTEQLARVNYVLDNTVPGDKVFDGATYFNLFRDDIDYLWFGLRYVVPTMKKLNGYEYDVYESIEKEKPKIIWTSNLKPSDPRIKNNYNYSEVYDNMLIRKEE
ncbi:glycosyltransferase family 39 protein [Candidatus Parcubacteria bacterium]|nr:glycosyltransferase family 39 protein [Candidatus Parcubacteria bacterium]